MTKTIVLLAALTFIAAAAAKPLPATRYWTAAQANTAVVKQATVPFCRVMACAAAADGTLHPRTDLTAPTPPVTIQSATCVGTAGFSRAGRYQRFTCAYVATGDVVEGKLLVYTASGTAIRWKRVEVGG